jgi:hypothetical protein
VTSIDGGDVRVNRRNVTEHKHALLRQSLIIQHHSRHCVSHVVAQDHHGRVVDADWWLAPSLALIKSV